jgi:hypothetical protein
VKIIGTSAHRRGRLLASAFVALATVASFLLGQIFSPSGAQKKMLLFARVQTPFFSHSFGAGSFQTGIDVMHKNDDYLDRVIGVTAEGPGQSEIITGFFKAAYDCKIRNFIWEPVPVNHLFSVEEVLIVPLDGLTERQAICISQIVVSPNVKTSIAAEGDLGNAVQRLIDRDPLINWN